MRECVCVSVSMCVCLCVSVYVVYQIIAQLPLAKVSGCMLRMSSHLAKHSVLK